jgi:hypothetical protein
MYIFGWIEPDLQVERLDWSVAKVAELGIHPWKLDLLDPKPIVVEHENRQLRFSRLDDIRFAYRDSEGRVIIGLCDGGERACVACAVVECVDGSRGSQRLTLRRVEELDDRFAEHFGEYLRRIYESKRAEQVFDSIGSIKYVHGGRVEFHADSIRDARELYPFKHCGFDGEMLVERHFRANWPEWVASLLALMKPWEPTIIGSAPRDLLLGRAITHVDIAAIGGKLPTNEEARTDRQLMPVLDRAYALRQAIEIAGHQKLVSSGADAYLVNGSDNLSFSLHPETHLNFSAELRVDAIRAGFNGHADRKTRTRPYVDTSAEDVLGTSEEIITSPIAMHDLAQGQSRILMRSPPKPLILCSPVENYSRHVEPKGLNLLADPFSCWHIADGCHCEPLVPAYINAFRTATCIDWESKAGSYNFEQVLEAYAAPPSRLHVVSQGCISQVHGTTVRGLASENEGEGGMSPQQMNDLLAKLAEQARERFACGKRDAACVTTFDVYEALYAAIYANDSLSDRQKALWATNLDLLNRHMRRKLAAAFQFAGLNQPERSCRDVLGKYLEHAEAYLRNAPVRLSDGTGQVDELFLQDIEKTPPLNITTSGAYRFRTEILNAMEKAAQTGSRTPELLNLRKAIEGHVLRSMRNSVLIVSPAAHEDSQSERLRVLKYRLQTHYGYCPGCMQELMMRITMERNFLCD